MPEFIGSVHPRFRTPHAAIIFNSVAVLTISLYSSFAQEATLAAIARLAIFVFTCAALIVFRFESLPGSGTLRQVVAFAGILLSIWLIGARTFAQTWILVAIVTAGTILWVVSAKRRSLQAL